MNRNNPKKLLSFVLIALVALGIVGYVYFRSRALLQGPKITIVEPRDGQGFDASLITISGKAKNISVITLNDKPIFTDTEGLFSEQLVLSPGYTIISLFGEDKFGKTTTETIRVFLADEPDSLEVTSIAETAIDTSETPVTENPEEEITN